MDDRSIDELFTELQSKREGLSEEEAKRRLTTVGLNGFDPPKKWKRWVLFLSQMKSPLQWVLIVAAIVSLFLGSTLDATIILIIIAVSVILGYFQEKGALNALEEILRLVESKIVVRRNGKDEEICTQYAVPGDVVMLNAGDLIPADCRLFEGYLHVDESSLTGESFPVEKKANDVLFYGSMVLNGFGAALVVQTSKNTKYGKIIQETRFKPPETSFEKGVRSFSFFLAKVTLFLATLIFILNVFFARGILESLLFSVALAVGLTPQLLPAVISVNLAHAAKKMARKKVLIKRLPSIENLGQMDILCADKTGTLTEGKLHFEKAVDAKGNPCETCKLFAFLNASFQLGYTNPLDTALLSMENKPDIQGHEKIDEIPFSFETKRMSVFVKKGDKQFLITKGALPQVLAICKIDEQKKQEALAYFEKASQEGFRTIAIASGTEKKEEGLTFLGFLQFIDPIKKDSTQAASDLQKMGVQVKIITGDHQAVALQIAKIMGLSENQIIHGELLKKADEATFSELVRTKSIFAEIEPTQKKQIILALRKNGDTVGFLGDGINDVAAILAADVGITVDSGTEAAKQAADIVLLEKNLNVLKQGVKEGRRTFANTLKYIYMGTSANFGNMFSMAAVSLFLPFFPLLPKQVLLTNLITDFPEMAIASDNVDPEMMRKPSEWNLPYIRKYMIFFGLLSSIFDFATFGVLLFYLKAGEAVFQTGWFIESVMTATLIVLVIRTRRSIFRSRPSKLLTFAILTTALGVVTIPLTQLGTLFGFVPLPLAFFYPLAGILAAYLGLAEVVKRKILRL